MIDWIDRLRNLWEREGGEPSQIRIQQYQSHPDELPVITNLPTDQNLANIVKAINLIYSMVSTSFRLVNTKVPELQEQVRSLESHVRRLEMQLSRDEGQTPGMMRQSLGGGQFRGLEEQLGGMERQSSGAGRESVENRLKKIKNFITNYNSLLNLIDESKRPDPNGFKKQCTEIYDRVREELKRPGGADYKALIGELQKINGYDLAITLCAAAELTIETKQVMSEKDMVHAMGMLAESAGMEIICPGPGARFKEEEHFAVQNEHDTGYKQGSILKTINRGFRRNADGRITLKAKVVVAM